MALQQLSFSSSQLMSAKNSPSPQHHAQLLRQHLQQPHCQQQQQSSPPREPTASVSETRAAKCIAIIIVAFVTSWLPLYTINTISCFCPDNCPVPEQLILVTIVLSHFNSAWNPALYAWGMRDFRETLRQVLCGGGMRQQSPLALQHVPQLQPQRRPLSQQALTGTRIT